MNKEVVPRGSWRFEEREGELWILSDNGTPIALIPKRWMTSEALANARLLAAAPTLLLVLKNVLNSLKFIKSLVKEES